MFWSLLIAFVVTPWASIRILRWGAKYSTLTTGQAPSIQEGKPASHFAHEEDVFTRIYRRVMGPMIAHAGWRYLFQAALRRPSPKGGRPINFSLPVVMEGKVLRQYTRAAQGFVKPARSLAVIAASMLLGFLVTVQIQSALNRPPASQDLSRGLSTATIQRLEEEQKALKDTVAQHRAEFRFVLPDGSIRQMESSGLPFHSPLESGGRLYGGCSSVLTRPTSPSGSTWRMPARAAAAVIPPPMIKYR